MSRSPYDRPRSGNDRRSDDRRRIRDPRLDERRGGRGYGGPPTDPPGGTALRMNSATIAVLAGVLIIGIGIGSAVTSTTQGDQGNIASAQQLDMAVRIPIFASSGGASASMDIEMYTTLNPSSSFVTQPTLQPGCVIRRENWAVLKEGVTSAQERDCKQQMNTFAYIDPFATSLWCAACKPTSARTS